MFCLPNTKHALGWAVCHAHDGIAVSNNLGGRHLVAIKKQANVVELELKAVTHVRQISMYIIGLIALLTLFGQHCPLVGTHLKLPQ